MKSELYYQCTRERLDVSAVPSLVSCPRDTQSNGRRTDSGNQQSSLMN